MNTFSHFAETSFLCALFREQDNSQSAIDYEAKLDAPFAVSSLVLFEFRHSTRLQTFRFNRDRTQGFSAIEATLALEALRIKMDAESLIVAPVDWADVYHRAEQISSQHAQELGVREMDTLHVATALHLGSKHFLTLDALQAKLARAVGLKSPLP